MISIENNFISVEKNCLNLNILKNERERWVSLTCGGDGERESIQMLNDISIYLLPSSQ